MAFVLAAFGATGCDGIWAKDAFAALQIKQAQVITSDCNIPAEPTSLYLDSGQLDVALPDGLSRPYKLPLSLLNAMASVGKSEAEELNNITLQSFTVSLSGDWYNNLGVSSAITWGDICPQKFEFSVGTVRIPPGGYVGALIDALQAGHAYCLRQLSQFYYAEVTATITARGRHGGTSIQSAPFKFRIEVCNGCLQTNYTDSSLVGLKGRLPQCEALFKETVLPGCFPGQDNKILCCSLKPENPAPSEIVCPAVPMGKPDGGV